MVCSDEAYRHLSGCVGPLAIVLLRVDVAKALRDVVVEDLRIVLLHDALDGRRRHVVCSVGRGVSLDVAVCHSEGKVCVRVEGLRHALGAAIYHLSAHVVAVCQLEFLVQA